MVDIVVRSDDVDKVVRNVRQHADRRSIERKFRAGLNRATKPIRAEMTAAIPAALPRRGGLAERMQAVISSSTSAKSGRSAGVSIRFRSRGYDIRTLISGRIRHPLFGNRLHWYDQAAGANPSEFTDEFENQKPTVLREVTRVMDDIAREVTNI